MGARAFIRKMSRSSFVKRTAPGANKLVSSGPKLKGTGKAWGVKQR